VFCSGRGERNKARELDLSGLSPFPHPTAARGKKGSDVLPILLFFSFQSHSLFGPLQVLDILSLYSVQDLRDLNVAAPLEKLLEEAALTYFKSKKMPTVSCPHCKCVFEISYHSYSTKISGSTNDFGLDMRPLSEKAQRHFLANRFKCRGCDTSFCRLCQAVPYHIGFNCEEYVEYKNAPKCRFCACAVLPGRNQVPNPEKLPENLRQVCSDERCVRNVSMSCSKPLPCGHWCCGVNGEKECLPCLVPDCKGHAPTLQRIASSERKSDEKSDSKDSLLMPSLSRSDSSGSTDLSPPPLVRMTSTEAKEMKELVKDPFERSKKHKKGRLVQNGEDSCVFCQEELTHGPCVQLECGHVFHNQCVIERLKAKWQG
jgi:hypothetical protein